MDFDKIVTINFDGACNNRGDKIMGIGVVAYEDDEILCESANYFNFQGTSNIAEWLALIEGLTVLKELQVKNGILLGDSQLVVKQFNGIYDTSYKFIYYYNEAWKIAKYLNVEVRWIPREQNTLADELSKEGLNQFYK